VNRDVIEGNWKQLKGQIKERWGKLTDDQLDVIVGKRDQLAGKLQELYGQTRDEIDRQIQEFEELHEGDRERQRDVADGR